MTRRRLETAATLVVSLGILWAGLTGVCTTVMMGLAVFSAGDLRTGLGFLVFAIVIWMVCALPSLLFFAGGRILRRRAARLPQAELRRTFEDEQA